MQKATDSLAAPGSETFALLAAELKGEDMPTPAPLAAPGPAAMAEAAASWAGVVVSMLSTTLFQTNSEALPRRGAFDCFRR